MVGMIGRVWGDWLLELPINTHRMAIAENGETVGSLRMPSRGVYLLSAFVEENPATFDNKLE